MRIGEVAAQAGVSVDTIRFYERRGVLPAAGRGASGYRQFQPATVERIQLAKRLQGLGFTLDEIVEALDVIEKGETTCEDERLRLQTVLARLDAKLAEIRKMRREVRRQLKSCEDGSCAFERES